MQGGDKEALLLVHEDGKKECITEINQKITRLSLPATYNYIYLQQWKNYLIFEILVSTEKEQKTCYGIMSLKGKIIKEPVYPVIISIKESILFGEQVGERIIISIHDAALKKISEQDYEFPLTHPIGNIFNEDDVYSTETLMCPLIYIYDDRLSLQISKYNGNTLSSTKAVLLDFSGKTIIPASWEFIHQLRYNQIWYKGKLKKSYYVVWDGADIDETNVITPNGKAALFSQDGKQLTEFKYRGFIRTDEEEFEGNGPIQIKAYFEGGYDVLDENANFIETIKD